VVFTTLLLVVPFNRSVWKISIDPILRRRPRRLPDINPLSAVLHSPLKARHRTGLITRDTLGRPPEWITGRVTHRC
jgi:hypothetical protein